MCSGAAARFQITILIRKAHDGVGVANINPLRIWTGRIERDAVGLLQSGGEGFGLLRLAVRRDSAEDQNFTGIAFGEKIISIGRGGYEPRIIEVGGVLLNLETCRSFGPCVLRARDHAGSIAGRLRGEWLRQILHCDFAKSSRLLKAIVGERSVRRLQFILGSVRRRNCRLGGGNLGSVRQRLNETNQLPALLRWQHVP